jgi:hypothetical protein
MEGYYTALKRILVQVTGLPPADVNRGSFEKREQYPLPAYPAIFIDDIIETSTVEYTNEQQTSNSTRIRFFSQDDGEALAVALKAKKAMKGLCSDPFVNFLINGLNATIHPDGVFEYSHNYTFDIIDF